jgi:hypothetical protein
MVILFSPAELLPTKTRLKKKALVKMNMHLAFMLQ